MPSTINVVSTKIKDKGVFDLDGLYKFIKDWLDFHAFGDENKVFRETRYVERIKGDAKNIDIQWKAERAKSEYFAEELTFNYIILGLKEVEIELDGRKIPTNKGQVEIRIEAKILTNRQKKFNRFFENIYENTIVRDRIDGYYGNLYNEVYGLVAEIKKFLALRRT